MKNLLILGLLFTFLGEGIGQKHDNNWLLGYGIPDEVLKFGRARINFDDIQYVQTEEEVEMTMRLRTTSAVYSDLDGDLLFYTNGICIGNSNHDTIPNSFGMNPGILFQDYVISGYNLPQGALALDFPEHPGEYFIFHLEDVIDYEIIDGWSPKFQYTHLDMNANGGNGLVIEKNVVLNEGMFANGGTHGVRHANGRDWWIVNADRDNNRYYMFLLSPEGVTLSSVQETGPPVADGLGQFVFSPDGSMFVRYEVHFIDEPHFVQFYNFNRCTGELEFISENSHDHFALAVGVAVSPNSRFAYCSSYDFVYQYDLWADDIPTSKQVIAEYTDNLSLGLPTRFYQTQLAPDGKIYITTQTGNDVLHIIHQPNRAGAESRFEEAGLLLPVRNAFTMPNNPNYRLGPIDGSPCDTLGIDNLPLCDFRYDLDTLDDKRVEFTEVTHYEPTDWYWTFGDGNTSTELNPVHEYAGSGTYEVCLTVSNAYGSDSKCRTLQIISTATAEVYRQEEITSLPNPARDFVYLQMQRGLPAGSVWQLHDAGGRLVSSQPLDAGRRQRIDLADNLASGLYFQTISHSGRVLWRERVTVLR